MPKKVPAKRTAGDGSQRSGSKRLPLGEELWSAVREACVAEFEERTGASWQSLAPRVSVEHMDHRRDVETEARKLYHVLRQAHLKAIAFANRHARSASPVGGIVAWQIMQWLRDSRLRLWGIERRKGEFVDIGEPRWEQPSSGRRYQGDGVLDRRAEIVRLFETYDMLGNRRRLDVREYTLVSLILGNRPAVRSLLGADKKVSIADVIQAEAQAMRLTLHRHGDRWFETEHVYDDDGHVIGTRDVERTVPRGPVSPKRAGRPPK